MIWGHSGEKISRLKMRFFFFFFLINNEMKTVISTNIGEQFRDVPEASFCGEGGSGNNLAS